MVISTVGIELSENIWLNKAGKFTFKVEKFEDDGFTNAGDQQFKLMFKGVEAGTQEPIFMHTERFSIGQKALWRIKQLEVALKAPETYEVEDFIGRYVIANVVSENYTKNDGTQGTAFKVKSWEYHTANDKLPPIPEAKQDANNDTALDTEVPTIEIDDSEIPF